VNTAVVIPARYGSTRFGGKVLAKDTGKFLVQHTWERACCCRKAGRVLIATDSEVVREACLSFGAECVMTRADHQSGTDRIAEANRTVRASYVLNVQADEPLVSAGQLQALARLIQGDCPMATLCTPFKRVVDFYNTNQVKVVMSRNGRALYFSRSRMPYSRDLGLTVDDAWVAANPCHKHLGLYAYRADFLEKFVALPPGQLEQIEKLEQLRALENVYPIAIAATDDPTIGVDTPEDAKKFEALLG
jgi:3-deoxy-manno-octulosonate cytidylyltransferase (CMP-KDO synthetase)